MSGGRTTIVPGSTRGGHTTVSSPSPKNGGVSWSKPVGSSGRSYSSNTGYAINSRLPYKGKN